MTVSTTNCMSKLINILKEKIPLNQKANYIIPQIWDSFNYSGAEKTIISGKQLSINPFNFFYECITKEIWPYFNENISYNLPLSKINGDTIIKGKDYCGGDWVASGSIYSLHVRTSTSWDHDGSGDLEIVNQYGFKETGTFLKTIALLPMLKRMGINTVYLLPIFKNSMKYLKGELGSPYAVKNFFRLDETLKDPLLGDDFTVNEEFQAFVEACHALGMRVIIDFVPRTSARDSDLIIDHPDWFYWIKLDYAPTYRSPALNGIKNREFGDQLIEYLYLEPNVIEHIKKFCYSPDQLDPEKWGKLKEYCKNNPSTDFLEMIEREFGVTTAPGFCDNADDAQSPWTDITYLRMYFDHPAISRRFLDNPEEQAPYVLYDVIKCQTYPGDLKNEELWELLASVLPFYQQNFGIDGARIDMGHSLPVEFEKLMLKRAREVDADFCFILETFSFEWHARVRELGYNMFAGDLWWMEPRMPFLTWSELNESFKHGIAAISVPVFACAEIADSPRAVSRNGGRNFSKIVAVMNNFMPNGVPFIFSGFEIYEIQPMNVDLETDGIDNRACMLPETDPFYGKLPFFDKYALHWTQDGVEEIPKILQKVSQIRQKYLCSILDVSKYRLISFMKPETTAFGLGFIVTNPANKFKENLLLMVANLDCEHPQELAISLASIREETGNTSHQASILYSPFECDGTIIDSFDTEGNLTLPFEPGEVKIILL